MHLLTLHIWCNFESNLAGKASTPCRAATTTEKMKENRKMKERKENKRKIGKTGKEKLKTNKAGKIYQCVLSFMALQKF